jgi:hypothetical protein
MPPAAVDATPRGALVVAPPAPVQPADPSWPAAAPAPKRARLHAETPITPRPAPPLRREDIVDEDVPAIVDADPDSDADMDAAL